MQKGTVCCPICAAPGAVLAKYPERITETHHWYAFKMLKCSRGHFFTAGDRLQPSKLGARDVAASAQTQAP
jgi:hypothetical protein